MEVKTLRLDEINVDGGTQARCKNDEACELHYTERMADGDQFPPLKACFDGSVYWLWDGFKRYGAKKRNGEATADVQVMAGTLRDAKVLACGANKDHGLPRTDEDKRNAVLMLLQDEEWSRKSTEEIRRHVGVSWTLVETVRQKVRPAQTERTGKNGRTYHARDRNTEQPASRTEKEPGDPVQGEDVSMATETDLTHARELTEAATTVKDSKGRLVPTRLESVFRVASEFRSLIHHLGVLKARVSELKTKAGGDCLHVSSIHVELDDAQGSIRLATPFVVCPRCDGSGCKQGKHSLCGGRGWLAEGQYGSLPREDRAKCEGSAT